jgi:hypothetical protein
LIDQKPAELFNDEGYDEGHAVEEEFEQIAGERKDSWPTSDFYTACEEI